MYIVHCLSESNCAGMNSVHGRVIADNMYESQHFGNALSEIIAPIRYGPVNTDLIDGNNGAEW